MTEQSVLKIDFILPVGIKDDHEEMFATKLLDGGLRKQTIFPFRNIVFLGGSISIFVFRKRNRCIQKRRQATILLGYYYGNDVGALLVLQRIDTAV